MVQANPLPLLKEGYRCKADQAPKGLAALPSNYNRMGAHITSNLHLFDKQALSVKFKRVCKVILSLVRNACFCFDHFFAVIG